MLNELKLCFFINLPSQKLNKQTMRKYEHQKFKRAKIYQLVH